MSQPLDYNSIAPDAIRPLLTAAQTLRHSGLPANLLALVAIRASQINGCGFCLALHVREAEAIGDSGDRLACLPGWREASFYDDRERAALEWTEALTRLSEGRPDDSLLARVREQFSDKELVYLTLAITNINAWNRFNVGFRTPPERAQAVFDQVLAQTHAH
jgi:AhpD family alkylhydroperoxidase